jgi:glycosyltransferase involved in cell wall biosynthesis
LLPGSLNSRLRAMAAQAEQFRPAPPIEDWSVPLIGRASSSANPMIRATPGAEEAHEPVTRDPGDAGAATEGAMPRLRCLVATPRLDVGGMDAVVAAFARQLPAHGLQTAVLHAKSKSPIRQDRPGGRFVRELKSSGIEVRYADETEARTWIRQWRPDVICSHGAPRWVFSVAQELGVAYVDYLHSPYRTNGRIWDWHAGAARAGSLSAVVAVSERVRQQYLAGIPEFPPERIVTIPNGVASKHHGGGDRDAARSWLGLGQEHVFVSLARHCVQKNSYGLIAAFDELARRRPEAHLVLAGRPDDRRYYRKMLRLRDTMACRDRIHLRDHVTAPDQLLAAADAFVLNSFFEGDSLSSMEALCGGVPAVLSDAGAADQQIGGDPARGYVVSNPAGDPLGVDWTAVAEFLYRAQPNHDELVDAMESLIADRDSYLGNRERLAAESRARFSADVCLARNAAVLRAAATGADLPVVTDALADSYRRHPAS